MMALLEREKTGKGQHVEAALSHTSATISAPYHVNHKNFVRDDIGGPGVRGLNALASLYESADNWLFLSVSSEDQWQKLCILDEFSDLQSMEIFSSKASRSENDLLLRETLEEIFITNPSDYWVEIMKSARIPLVKNTTVAEIHEDEFNHARGLIRGKDYSSSPEINSSWGKTTWSGNPVNMSKTPLEDVFPPIFGADTIAVLKELGISTEKIDQLRKAGVIPKQLPIKI